MKEPWYSVKMLLDHNGQLIEERVIVIHAESFDDAETKARVEIKDHLDGLKDVTFMCIVDIYHLFVENLSSPTEVYSHMTEHTGNRLKYLKRRYEKYDGEVVAKT